MAWKCPYCSKTYARKSKEHLLSHDPKLCMCIDYEGQNWNCTVHDAKMECPRCHTIDTAREGHGPGPVPNHYMCNICGYWYGRNMETGEYVTWAPMR